MYISPLLVGISALVPLACGQLHISAENVGLLYFGTETEKESFNDAPYQAALKNTTDFGQITPGNAMKWDSIEPQPGQFSFAAADAIVNIAKENNQILRCHTLVWHQQLPAWVTGGNWTQATLTTALQNHVTTEVNQYKGQCYAWDVVNEALNDNGTFRNSVFFRVLGQDYIRIAFEAAAAADPAAKLYYNDFNIETPGAKSTAAQEIVKSLKAANVKIDGVGFQSHFIVGATPSLATQVANLESFTALGVEVAITELDIRMTLPQTIALLNQQMKDYQTSTTACINVRGCVGVTVWDFGDKYSWIPSTFPGTGAGCLFDETVTKKPAYYGVLQAFRAEAANSTRLNSPQGNSTVSAAQLTASSGGSMIGIGALPALLGSLAFAILLS